MNETWLVNYWLFTSYTSWW